MTPVPLLSEATIAEIVHELFRRCPQGLVIGLAKSNPREEHSLIVHSHRLGNIVVNQGLARQLQMETDHDYASMRSDASTGCDESGRSVS